MRPFLPLLLLSLTGWFDLPAQTLMNLDSLLRRLPTARQDTATVQLLIQIGQQYEGSDPARAGQYYRRAGALSQKIGYPRGTIKFISNYTYLLNLWGRYDSSLHLNRHALALARRLNDSLLVAKMRMNVGTSYHFLADYQQAVTHYLQARQGFEALGDEAILAQMNDIIQTLYQSLQQYDKAVAYGEQAVRLSRKLGAPNQLGIALANLGASYNYQKQPRKAEPVLREALAIARRLGDINIESTVLLNLTDVLRQTGRYHQMPPYVERALPLFRRLGSGEGEALALRNRALYFLHEKAFDDARRAAEAALTLTRRIGDRNGTRKNLVLLSDVELGSRNLPAYERYRAQHDQLADSILSETLQKTVVDSEKKYESEKKEARIRQLNREQALQALRLRQQSTINSLLAGGAMAVVLVSLLLYRTYRQRQQLQQRRIAELEIEKQLLATEAILKGEEQERRRLAKDLHDGLGGMLSGIKHGFTTMNENLLLTPDDHQSFARGIDLLDGSIRELRRVAHNLMPETLVRFGLDTALRDFCADLNGTGVVRVVYQSFGLDTFRPEQSVAIAVYRIVQELVTNAVKHAEARQVLVQLLRAETQTLHVTVEDDGKGFDRVPPDPAQLGQAGGIGWSNVHSRVNYLRGTVDVHSEAGQGTSVSVTVPLP